MVPLSDNYYIFRFILLNLFVYLTLVTTLCMIFFSVLFFWNLHFFSFNSIKFQYVYWTYLHYPFIHWWKYGLVSFPGYCNRALMNMDGQVPIYEDTEPSEYVTRIGIDSGINGSYSRSIFTFSRSLHVDFQKYCISLYCHQIKIRILFPISLPAL